MLDRKVYISVVSHAQEDMIIENFNNFPKTLGSFKINLSIIDNTNSHKLKDFCSKSTLFYYSDEKTRGFGENNNKMFSLLNPKDDDIFIVCNPDVIIQKEQLEGLVCNFTKSDYDISTVKTYFDKETNYIDNPDKYFPGFFNFAYSLATDKRLHYGDNKNVKNPQWISGAFMVFNPLSYRKLNGFDESYFMYCEDIDLCFRAYKQKMKLGYDGSFYIEHNTQMQSRALFSDSMQWHIKSAVKFIYKNRFYNPLVIK